MAKSGRRAKGRGAARGRRQAFAADHRSAALSGRESWAVILGIAPAGLGLVLTAYLTALKWLGTAPAYCGAGSECDLVQASRWSDFMGLPLSLWGFATYALLAALLWRRRTRPSAWKFAFSVAAIGTGFSIYLTFVSLLEIEATCLYCLASLVFMSTILVALWVGKPPNLQNFDWGNWGIGITAALILVVGGMHLHYQGLFDPKAGPERPYLQALAQHLETAGAGFYGAYWCPQCQEQKDLFEASADRLPYIECTPAGRNGPVANACVTNRIGNYPTWIIDGRQHEGMLTPQALARLSGFKWHEQDGQ